MATAPSTLRVDPITKVLGNFGKWQLSTMLIIFLCKVPTSWFMAIILFTAPAPNPGIFLSYLKKICLNDHILWTGDFWCTPPSHLPGEYTADWIARAHPIKVDYHNRSSIDYCEVFTEFWENPLKYFGPNHTIIDTKNLNTRKCANYTFNPNYHSMVADFNLVCGRELLVPLSQCFHIFGLLVGGIIAYFLLK